MFVCIPDSFIPHKNAQTNTVVWVGATLMQENGSGDVAAAFSVYYGSNDSRNYTEKITINEKQDLDYVYTQVDIPCAILLYLHYSLTLILKTSLGGHSRT